MSNRPTPLTTVYSPDGDALVVYSQEQLDRLVGEHGYTVKRTEFAARSNRARARINGRRQTAGRARHARRAAVPHLMAPEYNGNGMPVRRDVPGRRGRRG